MCFSEKIACDLLIFEPKFKANKKLRQFISRIISYKIQDEASPKLKNLNFLTFTNYS